MLKENYNELHNAAMEKVQDIFNNIVNEFIVYSNTDGKDIKYYSKLPVIQLHITHAIGELLEAKALISELDSTEEILLKAYELEMEEILKAYNEAMIYDEILNEDNKKG